MLVALLFPSAPDTFVHTTTFMTDGIFPNFYDFAEEYVFYGRVLV